MRELNFCYAANDNFAPHMAVSITSLLENNNSHKIAVHILHADLSDASMQRIMSFENRYKNARIFFYKIGEAKFEKFSLSIPHVTKETYFRYLIPNILQDADRVLYLDADTVVNADISDLFKIDISEYYCSGVRDILVEKSGYARELGISGLYINAGVMLLNLCKMRSDGSVERLMQITSEKRFKFQDQDAFNVVFNGKIKELDCVYNFKRAHQKAFREKAELAKIIHYVGPSKPWLKFSINKHKRLYFKYKKISPYRREKIKVALLVDEYFGAWKTAYGGYGFLAREIVSKHLPASDIDLEVIIGRQKNCLFHASHRTIDGIKVWRLPRLDFFARRWLKKADYDCWLSIELSYDFILRLDSNPNRKLILWIQDPRPKSAWDKIGKMKKVKDRSFYNQKIYDEVKRWCNLGKVKFVTQGRTLSPLAKELYSMPGELEPEFLPNPVRIDTQYKFDIAKKEKIALFIGRLEAQKRAWIFCEIAKLMPEYDFYVMGKFHRDMADNKEALSPYLGGKVKNLHFCGHLVGAEKEALLRRARVLVNTSIWEGIPISWLEALSFGVPIVSAFDRENLVKNFGSYVGEIEGDGDNSAESFIEPIKSFLEDDLLCSRTALAAIDYIKKTHSFRDFEANIRSIIRRNFY